MTLALNDHLLKTRFPGWWTGKLSDVAGVAVVAVLAVVLLGGPVALLVTGAGFAALKTVPGVAEGLSPVLGGVITRDGGDLLALGVLLPLWWALDRRARPADLRPLTAPFMARPSMTDRPPLRGVTLSAVPALVGAVFAVFACTATSCTPRPAVVRIVSSDRAVYAEIDRGWSEPAWARSDDGGQTWARADRPLDAPAEPESEDALGHPEVRGPLRDCANDGTCYELRNQRRIERTGPDGSSTTEFSLTHDAFDAASTGCVGGQRGVLGSVAVTRVLGGSTAVASLACGGVVVRQADGEWERTKVPDVHLLGAGPSPIQLDAELVVGPVLAVVLWLVGRRRWPSWPAAVVIMIVGWLGSLAVAGIAAVSSCDQGEPRFLVPVGVTIILILAILVGRHRWSTARRALPPPPGAPPPELEQQ